MPGTIKVFCGGPDDPTIICLLAQWGPGKPGVWSQYYPKLYDDTKENREKWFQMCLAVLDASPQIDHVAMPYNIGCGLAGGDWETYKKMIDQMRIKVTLYQL